MNNSPRLDYIQRLLSTNKVINGSLDFWQRQNTFTGSDFLFLADRFQNRQSGSITSTINIDRSADTPSNDSNYSMLISNTNTHTITGGEVYAIAHKFEGNFVRDLYSKNNVILKFKVKANHTATYGLSVFNDGITQRDDSPNWTINQANTWETKLIEIDLTQFSGLATNNSMGFQIWWVLASGSSFGSSNYDNFLQDGNTIQFAEIELLDPDFYFEEINFSRAGRNYVEELQLCERYFEKTYDVDVNPSTSTPNGQIYFRADRDSGNALGGSVNFRVIKRDLPIVTLYALNGAINQMSSTSSNVSANASGIGQKGYHAIGVITNSARSWHHTADAEL